MPIVSFDDCRLLSCLAGVSIKFSVGSSALVLLFVLFLVPVFFALL